MRLPALLVVVGTLLGKGVLTFLSEDAILGSYAFLRSQPDVEVPQAAAWELCQPELPVRH